MLRRLKKMARDGRPNRRRKVWGVSNQQVKHKRSRGGVKHQPKTGVPKPPSGVPMPPMGVLIPPMGVEIPLSAHCARARWGVAF